MESSDESDATMKEYFGQSISKFKKVNKTKL